MRDDVSRRQFLETGALAATLGLTTTLDDVDTDDPTDRIPAPFDAMPTLEAPPEEVRERARGHFLPPWAVPDTGPIPDFRHQRKVRRPITVPEWGLEAVRWRLSHHDPDHVDRWRVEELLMEYAALYEEFVTPDGRDAVAMLLEEFDP